MATGCPTIPLSSGYSMPAVGLGTFDNLKSGAVCEATKAALDCGYRLIDCAYIYRSEGAVGEAIADRIQAGVLKREDLFVTTKLWNTFHEPERVEKGMRESLQQLGLDYVDLFLMHWPMAYLEKTEQPQAWILDKAEPAAVDFVDTWKAMEKLVELGLAKSIGVSNFNIPQLTKLLQAPLNIRPANMQIESHPLLGNQELIDFCRKEGITVTAYSPLAKGGSTYAGKKLDNLLDDQRIVDMATKHKKTPAQIFDFTLSEEDMAAITAMNKNQRIVTVESFKGHPEYPF